MGVGYDELHEHYASMVAGVYMANTRQHRAMAPCVVPLVLVHVEALSIGFKGGWFYALMMDVAWVVDRQGAFCELPHPEGAMHFGLKKIVDC